MSKRQELYDELCELLTAFENPEDETWDRTPDDFFHDFYEMLCRIANNWEEI